MIWIGYSTPAGEDGPPETPPIGAISRGGTAMAEGKNVREI